MIAEELKLWFDIPLLREHLEKFVLPLPLVTQSSSFGGWSVTSSTGSYQDGWQQGHKVFKEGVVQDAAELAAKLRAAGLKKIREYRQPTEICHGYLKEVIDTIDGLGFYPCRVRIIRLSPQSSSSWHRDAPDWTYCVRLHIPIITYANCFFETEEERVHLPATGSAYLLRVNRIHRVINESEFPRFHLVCDVWDTKAVSQSHHYQQPV